MCPKRSGSLFDVVGSGVNHLRELGWETGTIEQQVRNRVQQFGIYTSITNYFLILVLMY